MDKKLLDAAAAAAREVQPEEPRQHVLPAPVPLDFEVGVVPATKANKETGETEQVFMVHLIIHHVMGTSHIILEDDLAGELGEHLQGMAVQARARKDGLVVPEGRILKP